IGLELKRELYQGELSSFRSALLPAIAAAGGMVAPAAIHLVLNAGTPTEAGFGIPMATDIAFALGALALLGTRVPSALKVFVVAFAVIDDLGAIVLIAVAYTDELSVMHLYLAAATLAGLLVLNAFFRVMALWPYLLGGVLLWYAVHGAGVHASIAGVLLAFAIPFWSRNPGERSASARLEHHLHRPVAFIILPLFALANTAITLDANALGGLASANALGISAGLAIGKPVGILLFCFAAVAVGICRLPGGVTWRHVIGAGILGGIGFTMSIFIANLAFANDVAALNASKLAVLGTSLFAGVAGWAWLRWASSADNPRSP
ncbi:MAG: nhaA, partial [Steroidobacteraceae bacterium]|nr:nhaA [Steroidobacteraceae bacterium]